MAKQSDMKQAARESLEKSAQAIQSSNGGTGIPGVGLMQTRSSYTTAVQVIKERDLQVVLRKCLEEAAIAGEDFYYSWKQGGSPIEGLAIGAALCVARNYGNCAVETTIQEMPDKWLANPCFIDLETGFNYTRPYPIRKTPPVKKDGSPIYEKERGEAIIFQVELSKAIRNVILNAVPKWLTDKVMEKAKENVVAIIEKMGIVKARDMLVKKIAALGIALESVEVRYGRHQSWEIEQCVQIRTALKAIEDGVESADDLFPKKIENGKAEVVQEGTGTQKPNAEPVKAEPVTAKAEALSEFERLEKKIPTIKDQTEYTAALVAINRAFNNQNVTAQEKDDLMNILLTKGNSLGISRPEQVSEQQLIDPALVATLRLKVLTPMEFNHELDKVGFGEFKTKLWKEMIIGDLVKIVKNSQDEAARNRAYTTIKRSGLQ